MDKLIIGNIYKSLAGCPVRLLELKQSHEIWAHPSSSIEIFARVEYISETNNYGYGKGAIGWLYAKDLTTWEGDVS